GVYQFYLERHEASIAQDYAAAGTSTDKLKQFAAGHEGHTLGGTAYLRIADEAYAAGKFGEAQTAYAKAIASLKDSPFGARAKVGAAMSILSAGNSSEGQLALKKIVDDSTQFKGLRTQACYQLASLASQAGNSGDVRKYTDQLLQIDASSPWAQYALLLRSKLPAGADAKPAPGNTEIKLSPPGK
ncbi:MAG: hypothetical protein WC378_09720, partial [Opitutaceae bacterium]